MRTFLLFLCSFSLFAQVSGRIAGSVTDASGAVVPGAEVRLSLPGGAKSILVAQTTAEGLFNFAGVAPGLYDLAVEAKGFSSYHMRAVKVDPAREISLQAIKLDLASITQTLEVSADIQSLQTSNSEISTTVTNQQVRRLPILDRNPLDLIRTQAGVSSNGRSDTVINGQRTSYSNMTMDGINIQDNFIRDNALDYTPNMPLIDQVAEFTVATSNANSSLGGGSSQVVFVTPSGTNTFHGTGYWYNRNNAVSANDWFNNRDGVERPFLNQNQIGGSLGGPIKKDKLLFYTNYEAYRQHQQDPHNRTILTSDARQGLFTYRNTSGVVQKVNVLTAAKVQADPVMQGILAQVPGPEAINNYDLGDSKPDFARNTAGYRFNQRSNRIRDNYVAKLEYNLSPRHILSGTFLWNRDNADRSDYSSDYSAVPKTTNPNHSKLASLGWRWNPASHWTNEVRGGFNRAPGDFLTSQKFGAYIVDGMVYSNPVDTFRAQGRGTNTYNLSDNAGWTHGRHNVQFGFQMQRIGVKEYDDAGIAPTYTLGIGSGNTGLVNSQLPGASRSDVTAANNLLATLAGYVTSYSQTFNIADRTSGFVPGTSFVRRYTFNDYAFYAQDAWRIRPRVTLTMGLRYSLYSAADENDSLLLLPKVSDGNAQKTLLSNATLDFAGASAGRPLYSRDKNNFAPNFGLAWDVFGNGRTALRGGYSINFVNDQGLLAPIIIAGFNAGLTATAADYGTTGRVGSSLPPITTPGYKVPRTAEDNYADDPGNALGLIDPNLRTPYVQQWNIGVQQEFKGTIFEARYVGNHATKGYRAFDYNQVIIRENGFLDDFKRAQSNGALAKTATGTFNPSYNASIPGSQPLLVFPKLYRGGQLTNSSNRSLIEAGEAGELAAQYQMDGNNGSVDFFRSPYTLGADYLTNYSNSTYNSLQVEVRRRMAANLDINANYTFSKVLSDSAGTSQSRVEHFLDLASAKIERARADFDLTHAIKASTVYDIPLFRRNRWLGGWSASGIVIWQSGTPFSVLSGRGTLNRASGYRSENNTANTVLTKPQTDVIFQFRQTGDGPMYVPASVLGTDGRAVAADGETPFAGQRFFNPGPGELGSLQRRMFDGPWDFNLDFGLQKTMKITERQSLEFRMESTNVLNHPQFMLGDQNINSTDFGMITYTFSTARRIQFGLYYRF